MFNKVVNKQGVIFFVCCSLIIIRCGLFSQENAENPIGVTNVDPLNFKAILNDNNEKFDFQDYNGLFYENFIYTDPEGISYSRDRVKSRLNTIEAKYVHDSVQDIMVNWVRTNLDDKDPLFDKQKEILLAKRTYEISFIDSLNLTMDSIYYSGEATIKLRYHNLKEVWVISYLRDIPVGGLKRSFFHPDFSN